MDVQWQIKQNVSEANSFIEDLQSWKKEIKKKQRSKKKEKCRDNNSKNEEGEDDGSKASGKASAVDLDNYVPPVRGRVQVNVRKLGKEYRQPSSQLTDHVKGLNSQETKTKKKKGRKKKPKKVKTLPQHAAGHTYDYFKDKWDKFDVNAALEEASQSSSYETEEEEEEEEEVIEEIVNPSLPPETIVTKGAFEKTKKSKEASMPTTQKSQIQKVNTDLSATQWKEKGNDYFRTAQYQRALECYTGSINAEPSAVAYANRAMALMKLREFEQAVDDASESLEIDPTYLKAYQRRGAAYKELGSYFNALRDYESALRLSPQSQALKEERRLLIETFCSKEGLERVKSRVKLPLSDLRENIVKMEKKPSTEDPSKKKESSAKEEKARIIDQRSKVEGSDNEGNEISGDSPPSPHTKRDRTIQTKAVNVNHVPLPASGHERELPTPKTAVDFEITWKSIKENEDSKWTLLRKLEPEKMAGLVKNMLTGNLVFSIVKCILTKMKESQNGQDTEHGIRLLENMAQTPRFKINVMSIPSKQRAVLKSEWDYHINSAPEELKKSIVEVAKLYGAIK